MCAMVAAPTTKSALSGIHTHANHKWQRSKSLSWVEAVYGGFGMIQDTYTMMEGSNISSEQWTTCVIILLLKATHGQWAIGVSRCTIESIAADGDRGPASPGMGDLLEEDHIWQK